MDLFTPLVPQKALHANFRALIHRQGSISPEWHLHKCVKRSAVGTSREASASSPGAAFPGPAASGSIWNLSAPAPPRSHTVSSP